MALTDIATPETPVYISEGTAKTSFCKDAPPLADSSNAPRTTLSDNGQTSIQIAIVGMAMRLPGDVRTSKDFWDFLINKKDGHGRVPSNRYEADAFYHPFGQGCTKTKHGYFLREDPAYFDAGFFDMTAYEASHIDPQQRLLLEVVWECLENAGEVNWEGKDIGCYVGVFGEDWLGLSLRDPLHTDRSHALSTGGFALANMVSYKYDFRGPR